MHQFREKVIDQHFLYNPSVQDTVSLAYQGENGESPFNNITDYKNFIIQQCDYLKLNNIRIIQKILHAFEHDINKLFNGNTDEKKLYIYRNIISSLCLYAANFYSEIIISDHIKLSKECILSVLKKIDIPITDLYNNDTHKQSKEEERKELKQKSEHEKKAEYLKKYGLEISYNFNFHDLYTLIDQLIIYGFWSQSQQDKFKELLQDGIDQYVKYSTQKQQLNDALSTYQKLHGQFINDADKYFQDVYDKTIDIIPHAIYSHLDWGVSLLRQGNKNDQADELIKKIIETDRPIELYNEFIELYNGFPEISSSKNADLKLKQALEKKYSPCQNQKSLYDALKQMCTGGWNTEDTEIVSNTNLEEIQKIIQSPENERAQFKKMLKILLEQHPKFTLKILSDMMNTDNNLDTTSKTLYKYQIQNYFNKEIKTAISKIENENEKESLLISLGLDK